MRGEAVMRGILDKSSSEPAPPGQPPYRKTGRLQDSCGHSVARKGDVIEASITNDAPYAQALIDGGHDFATPVRSLLSIEAPLILAENLKSAFSQ